VIRLPGVCIVCRAPVVWTGKQWKAATNLRREHECLNAGPVCGAWMRQAKERCARRPGHVAGAHRTAYAMANQYRAAMGRERVA